MPRYNSPIFPTGSNTINAQLSFHNKDGYITYFNFCTPIHRHPIDDIKTFRLLVCSFCSLGSCRPCEIVKAFGINERTLMRDLELYRTEGSGGLAVIRSVCAGLNPGSPSSEAVRLIELITLTVSATTI